MKPKCCCAPLGSPLPHVSDSSTMTDVYIRLVSCLHCCTSENLFENNMFLSVTQLLLGHQLTGEGEAADTVAEVASMYAEMDP